MSEVTTVDPATGRRWRPTPGPTSMMSCRSSHAVHAAQPAWAARPVEERAALVRASRRAAAQTGRRPRRADDRRDGQADRRGPGRGREVGDRVRLLRRLRSGLPRRAPVETDGPRRSWVAHEPLGVVLAVMPWNFPLWQVLRFAAPTLLAGNTAILKHSPNVTGCALAIERVFRDAGLPEGVFRSIVVAEADVPEREPGADRGRPDRRGEPDRQRAGRRGRRPPRPAGSSRRRLLELGGSDPFVVLADADLDLAVGGAVKSRFINSGQSCLAAKRFVVHADVAERVQPPVRCRRGGPARGRSTGGGDGDRADGPGRTCATGSRGRCVSRWRPAPPCSPAAPLWRVPAPSSRRPCWATSLSTCPSWPRRRSAP